LVSRSPEFAFGFRNLFADLAWLQAVQESGSRMMTREQYDRFADLVQSVIRFDPRFVVPYLMGGMVLGDSADHTATALRILGWGEERFPSEWRFPFYIGYHQYFSLGNPVEGGKALLKASRIHGSPAYFPLLASRMLSEGNRPETALAYLREMVAQETDSMRKQFLEERIRRVVVERDLQLLEAATAEYLARAGTYPAELDDLVRFGLLARIPDEPYGGRYLLGRDGRVRSDRAPAERLKVLRPR
jgi:hypothetical protein